MNPMLSNSGALFAAIGVEDYSNIYGGYTLYNLLSFVQESGHGILGFPVMLLMVAMVRLKGSASSGSSGQLTTMVSRSLGMIRAS